jgi:hypothetical protein
MKPTIAVFWPELLINICVGFYALFSQNQSKSTNKAMLYSIKA